MLYKRKVTFNVFNAYLKAKKAGLRYPGYLSNKSANGKGYDYQSIDESCNASPRESQTIDITQKALAIDPNGIHERSYFYFNEGTINHLLENSNFQILTLSGEDGDSLPCNFSDKDLAERANRNKHTSLLVEAIAI